MAPGDTTQVTGQRSDGVPVYGYVRRPDSPPVSVLRFSAESSDAGRLPGEHAHAHDFLVLAYFERGGGRIGLDDQKWSLSAGDAFVIGPGEVVRMTDPDHGSGAEGWGVFFPPEIIASAERGGSLGWRAHPLLFPFVGRGAGGAQRLRVPAGQRTAWSERVRAIEHELREPRDGSSEAALAHLTLLLVDVARVAPAASDDLRLRREPLLAAVFEFIDQHYHEPISLADVAAEVGLTPGHLTTVVRRKTGRTAQRWIAERRMAEARRLLRETDETVEEISASVGYRQPSFFIAHFRRDHATTPAVWRRRTRTQREGWR